MAVVTAIGTPAAGINYTFITDTSADFPSVANSTYFYNKADKLVRFKDATGTVLEVFSASATPAGITGQIQFNNAGTFGADSNLFWDNTNKRLGIGATPASTVRLDVRSQGALSTDIAFRVRNSADSADLFTIRGNGEMYLPQVASNSQNIIYMANITTDTLLRYSATGNGSIAFGQKASIVNATYYNTAIGNEAATGVSASFGIAIGFATVVNSSGGIAIGDRAKTSGIDTIVIGTTGGNTTYSGTRSIYLGKKGNTGNSFTSDDVFMTHFNSDSSSTLIRANGSLGLLGQQAYVFTNGTGLYGTDTFMGNGGNTLVVRNHTSVPSTNIAQTFQMYSNNIITGNAAPHFRTENGDIIKLYKQTLPAIPTITDITNLLTNLGLM